MQPFVSSLILRSTAALLLGAAVLRLGLGAAEAKVSAAEEMYQLLGKRAYVSDSTIDINRQPTAETQIAFSTHEVRGMNTSYINASKFIEPVRVKPLWSTVQTPDKAQGNVIAGIVNHHALASDLLARFFMGLKRERPKLKRIIILSPDHFMAGHGDISVNDRAYATRYGMVLPDERGVEALTSSGIATTNDGLFEAEHGVGALVTFLRHEFEDVEILAVTVKQSIARERAEKLAETLNSLMDDDTVVISSSDMSHYLPAPEALRNDDETLNWFRSGDQESFWNASDDWIDSGRNVWIVYRILELQGLNPSFTAYDHKISTDYGGDDHYTTSYITGVWTED